jgi:hypothetical protein
VVDVGSADKAEELVEALRDLLGSFALQLVCFIHLLPGSATGRDFTCVRVAATPGSNHQRLGGLIDVALRQRKQDRGRPQCCRSYRFGKRPLTPITRATNSFKNNGLQMRVVSLGCTDLK